MSLMVGDIWHCYKRCCLIKIQRMIDFYRSPQHIHHIRLSNRSIQPIKIALFEEHPEVRQALVTRLGSSPLVQQVMTSFNPQTWNEWRSYDVLLLGLPMKPRNDNGQVEQLLSRADQEKVPVIALASYAQDEERESLLAAGVAMYLLKNIDTQYLIDMIMNVVFANL